MRPCCSGSSGTKECRRRGVGAYLPERGDEVIEQLALLGEAVVIDLSLRGHDGGKERVPVVVVKRP